MTGVALVSTAHKGPNLLGVLGSAWSSSRPGDELSPKPVGSDEHLGAWVGVIASHAVCHTQPAREIGSL